MYIYFFIKYFQRFVILLKIKMKENEESQDLSLIGQKVELRNGKGCFKGWQVVEILLEDYDVF